MSDQTAERGAAGSATKDSTETGKTKGAPVGDRIQATITKMRTELRAANETMATAAAPGTGNRQARLRLTRLDPWSVMKMAFLLSIAVGIVTIIAVAIVWGALSLAGVWDSINDAVRNIVGEESSDWNITEYFGTARVLGFTMIVSVINVVLLTAMATLGAFLYNMAAALLGGVEVTLTEDN